MISDAATTQVRYMQRVLGEAPRDKDGQIVLDAETETDFIDSLGRMEEILTGRPYSPIKGG